jgi:hypothetical protein
MLTPSPKDVAVLDDDVADIDADAKLDAAVRRQSGVAFGHHRLHLARAAQCVDDAGEFDQEAVTGGLDDAAMMGGDFRIDHLGAERLDATERPFLVGLDEPRVTCDIGREDRCKPTFDASWPCGVHGASLLANDPIPTTGMRALGKGPQR